ncbi:MAG: diacylglycerol kinase [Chloroflexi bacterium]|nr:diacylglycerol kinase [Chloroflexota bacterium]
MRLSEFDILRLLRATKHALRGFGDAFRSQVSIRQEVIIILVGTPLALWLGENGVERALLIGALLLILLTELLNAAIETTIDRIGPEHHELSRKAKDMAATAVLVSLIMAAIVWLLILLD